MKANELMVDDWVYMSENDIPRRITDIGRFDLISSYGISCYVDNIHPIPITPEILEKNGFENQGYFSECTLGDWRILCDTKNVAIIHREHCNMDTPIEYVHDLQHCLKLCRIDKAIVL